MFQLPPALQSETTGLPVPAVELSGVSRRFSTDPAAPWILRELDLTVGAGEFVAIVGESGGGKSTLLNLIAGLDEPNEGQIKIAGQSLADLDEEQKTLLRRQQIGFVFQAYHLLNHLSAWQNVALPLLLNQVESDQARATAVRALQQLGLGHRVEAPVPLLSGGEQQRVALARALIHRPRLLLADEPTGNLDPASAEPAIQLLRDNSRLLGASVIMVTHSAVAAKAADRCLILRAGNLHEQC